MNYFKRAAALLLALLMLLAVAGCGGKEIESDTETETGTETDSGIITAPTDDGYLARYGDFNAADVWLRDNILNTDNPPVYFVIGKNFSDELEWKKTVGETVTVTDYPNTDDPAQRNVQEIEYVCEAEQLKVTLTLTTYPGFPIIEYDAHLTNMSENTTGKLKSFQGIHTDIDAGGEKYFLHFNNGSAGYAATEYMPHVQEIKTNALKLKTSNGLPTVECLPYFNAESESGGGVIAAVKWQGSWSAEFRMFGGAIRIRADQDNMQSVMLGGESFKFPGAVLLFYKDADWQYGQNIWRRWVIKHNLMRNTGRRDFKQNVFCCSGFPGAKVDINDINAFAERGLPEKYNCVFEYDAGWYCDGFDNWYGTVGNWMPSRLYDNGRLKQVSDACHAAGIDFCMWIEPERLFSQTESAPVLGDNTIYVDSSGKYLKYDDAKEYNVMGLINYGKQEAQDFVVNLVSGAVKEYGMDVYRQDFNTNNGQFWDAYDAYEGEQCGATRKGATENHACEGYIKAWTRIEEENPGLIFDACAGGGRRYDLETMRFAFIHTKSDYWAEVNSQQCQNFGMYSWNIFTGTGFADVNSEYDIRSRLTLSIGIGIAGADETTDHSLEVWNSMQKYMYGDYYQLSEYSLDGDANIAMQFCDWEKGEGMFIAYLRVGGIYDIKAKGLDANAKYKVWDRDDPENYRVMTGKTLMEDGWLSAVEGMQAAAVIVFYEKTDMEPTPFDRDAALKAANVYDFSQLKPYVFDESEFLAIAAKKEISDDGVIYLCPDYKGSGGVYLIGEKLYKRLSTRGLGDWGGGWNALDGGNVYITFEGNEKYPISQWGPYTPFDMRGFIKEIDGKYYLWLENSFSLGDPDGNWTNGTRYIYVDRHKSEPFTFVVSSQLEIGGRDIQYVSIDESGSGTVYICSDEVFSTLPRGESGKSAMGIEWTEIDYSKFYVRYAKDGNWQNQDDDAYINNMSGMTAHNKYGVSIWVGENGNGKFIWLENGYSQSAKMVSERFEIYYAAGDTLYRKVAYIVTGTARVNVKIPPKTLIQF